MLLSPCHLGGDPLQLHTTCAHHRIGRKHEPPKTQRPETPSSLQTRGSLCRFPLSMSGYSPGWGSFPEETAGPTLIPDMLRGTGCTQRPEPEAGLRREQTRRLQGPGRTSFPALGWLPGRPAQASAQASPLPRTRCGQKALAWPICFVTFSQHSLVRHSRQTHWLLPPRPPRPHTRGADNGFRDPEPEA